MKISKIWKKSVSLFLLPLCFLFVLDIIVLSSISFKSLPFGKVIVSGTEF